MKASVNEIPERERQEGVEEESRLTFWAGRAKKFADSLGSMEFSTFPILLTTPFSSFSKMT